MSRAHGNVLKRGRDTVNTSPEENKVKNASLNVTDIPASTSCSSTASSCSSLLSMDEEVVDDSFDVVPSFDTQLAAVLNTRPTLLTAGADLLSTEAAKRQRLYASVNFPVASSSSSSNVAPVPALPPLPPKVRQPMGRPKKPVPENPPPKRPVGRPRIHPKKEVDPNRQKRVPKGDKPLGRPRTRPPTPPDFVKRPRGRPRKIVIDPEALTLPDSPLELPDGLSLSEDLKSSPVTSDLGTQPVGASLIVAPAVAVAAVAVEPAVNVVSRGSARHTPPPAALVAPVVPTVSGASAGRVPRSEPGARHSARLTPPSTAPAAIPVAPNSNSSSGASKSDAGSKRRGNAK